MGETNVFIAISSVHRIDALDACKYVIDELKATVPIWKKEVLANGEVWKENSEFLERRLELGKKGWRLGKRLRPRCMTRRAAGTRVKSMKLPTAPVIKLVEQLLIYRFFFFIIIVTLRIERSAWVYLAKIACCD